MAKQVEKKVEAGVFRAEGNLSAVRESQTEKTTGN